MTLRTLRGQHEQAVSEVAGPELEGDVQSPQDTWRGLVGEVGLACEGRQADNTLLRAWK